MDVGTANLHVVPSLDRAGWSESQPTDLPFAGLSRAAVRSTSHSTWLGSMVVRSAPTLSTEP